MKNTYSDFVRFGLTNGLVVMLCAGCGKKGVAAPSIELTKAIAQEGFIFGLPIVMMGSLADGTNYEQQTILNATAKQLVVTSTNPNYQKLGAN